ncbi:MAG: adenine phosphoribosyltransferase [bacterium]|jgi:adenine phosphoribosyltransferase
MDCQWVERLNTDSRKYKLIHGLDGRGIPLQSESILEYAKKLAQQIQSLEYDYIIGFAEGGLIPAFALAQITGKPFLGSYRVRLDMPDEIHFTEPHSARPYHYVYGLKPGDRVLLVEDEITTGSTSQNAILSLEKNNISVAGLIAYCFCGEDSVLDFFEEQKIVVKYLEKYSIKQMEEPVS